MHILIRFMVLHVLVGFFFYFVFVFNDTKNLRYSDIISEKAVFVVLKLNLKLVCVLYLELYETQKVVLSRAQVEKRPQRLCSSYFLTFLNV